MSSVGRGGGNNFSAAPRCIVIANAATGTSGPPISLHKSVSEKSYSWLCMSYLDRKRCFPSPCPSPAGEGTKMAAPQKCSDPQTFSSAGKASLHGFLKLEIDEWHFFFF